MAKVKVIEGVTYSVPEPITIPQGKFEPPEIDLDAIYADGDVAFEDENIKVEKINGEFVTVFKDDRELITNEPKETQELFAECEKSSQIELSFSEDDLMETLAKCEEPRPTDAPEVDANFNDKNIPADNNPNPPGFGQFDGTSSTANRAAARSAINAAYAGNGGAPRCVTDAVDMAQDFSLRLEAEEQLRIELLQRLREYAVEEYVYQYAIGFDDGVAEYLQQNPNLPTSTGFPPTPPDPLPFGPKQIFESTRGFTNQIQVNGYSRVRQERLIPKLPNLTLGTTRPSGNNTVVNDRAGIVPLAGVFRAYGDDLKAYTNARQGILQNAQNNMSAAEAAVNQITAQEVVYWNRIFNRFESVKTDVFNTGKNLGREYAKRNRGNQTFSGLGLGGEVINFNSTLENNYNPIPEYNRQAGIGGLTQQPGSNLAGDQGALVRRYVAARLAYDAKKREYDILQADKASFSNDINAKLAECLGDELAEDNSANPPADPNNTAGYTNDLASANIYPVTSKDYWVKFASLATVVNLIPIHWPIGLIIPTPAGPVKIPLPIIWTCLAVIPTPVGLVVIFLGICGICPSPFIMIINSHPTIPLGPVGPNSAWFPVAIRPMVQIKDGIGSKAGPSLPLANFNVGGVQAEVDINPALSLLAIFIQDDFPQWERLKLSNIPFLAFLNVFCAAGKKGGGFLEF